MDRFVPAYAGLEWVSGALPTQASPWVSRGGPRKLDAESYDASLVELRRFGTGKALVLPNRTLFFLCDVHADTDAFFTSLVASGGVRKTGTEDDQFELTSEGRRGVFVIAGDCFDKGPHNLRLIRALSHLVEAGADVRVLAGNHDLRTLVGLSHIGRKEARFAHLFVRMGKKTMPLLLEVYNEYLEPGATSDFSEEELRELLFPDEDWYDEFPEVARGLVPEKKIVKEVVRIREKCAELLQKCEELDMTLGMVHAAAMKAAELFSPGGEFGWFFERMRLAERWGSLLLVHAGIDDKMAQVVSDRGVEGANDLFAELLARDLFELYNGPVGNMFRTKYRAFELPLTEEGVEALYGAGIYGVVHGHKNITRGQKVLLRRGLLNLECDVSMDCNTRVVEGLEGEGGGVLVLRGDGRAIGVSTDFPTAKVLDLAEVFDLVVSV